MMAENIPKGLNFATAGTRATNVPNRPYTKKCATLSMFATSGAATWLRLDARKTVAASKTGHSHSRPWPKITV